MNICQHLSSFRKTRDIGPEGNLTISTTVEFWEVHECIVPWGSYFIWLKYSFWFGRVCIFLKSSFLICHSYVILSHFELSLEMILVNEVFEWLFFKKKSWGNLYPIKLKKIQQRKHSLEMLVGETIRTNKQIPILACDSTLLGFHF